MSGKKNIVMAMDSDTSRMYPRLFIGRRVVRADIKKGAILFAYKQGTKLRVNSVEEFAEEKEGEVFNKLVVNATAIRDDDSEGSTKDYKFAVAHLPHSVLRVKMADIPEDHHRLLYDGQYVSGTIKHGVFQADDKYLVDWFKRFEGYFRLKRTVMIDEDRRVAKVLDMLRPTMDRIGHAWFNKFIRDNFVGPVSKGDKKDKESRYFQAANNLHSYDVFNDGYVQRMFSELYTMDNVFRDAVYAVVFGEGIKIEDYESLSRFA